MKLHNTYEESCRAAAYDELGLSGTYGLTFWNLPRILSRHTKGTRALDFGCGTGRSSRFLKTLGFEVTGLDISAEMVAHANQHDPGGDYRVIDDGDFRALPQGGFDLVQAAFPFDNISGHTRRVRLMAGLRDLLTDSGILVNIVSTPEIYTHEWVTFSTRAYPENRQASSGDVVRIVTTKYSDARPVHDIVWSHESYQQLYDEASLELVSVERPLATGDEGVAWKSEETVAPWAIYVLRRRGV